MKPVEGQAGDAPLGPEQLDPLEGFEDPLVGRVDQLHGAEEDFAEERRGVVEHVAQRPGRLGPPSPPAAKAAALRGDLPAVGVGRVVLDHVEVDRDVPRLVAVDQLHGLVAHAVVDVVVEGTQQRHVEDQLARRDVEVGDLRRQIPNRVDEVRAEALQSRVDPIGAVLVHVVVAREAAGDFGVSNFVHHEGVEDLMQDPIPRTCPLLAEERRRQTLDPGHVREVLDDRDLVFARHGAGRHRPVQVVGAPLIPAALGQHALEVHVSRVAAWGARLQGTDSATLGGGKRYP